MKRKSAATDARKRGDETMKRKSKRGGENGSVGVKRTKIGRVASRFVGIVASTALLTSAGSVGGVAWGQNAPPEKGSASVLESTRSNGRFVGTGYRGALAPSAKPEESRFSSGSGVDASRAGGRFVGANEFQSKQNFDLFYWRNELLRLRSAARGAERAVGGSLREPGAPRLVTAKEPKTIPLSDWRGGVRYGRTAEEIEAARKAELAAAQAGRSAGTTVPVPEFDAPYVPETIWMRGRAPIRDPFAAFDREAPNGGFAPENVWNAPVTERGWVELDGRVRSEVAGAAANPNGAATDLTPFLSPPAPSPEEKRLAYQEYLTTRLLQTPEVNPLSPISVEFRDGVATARGIVPTPSAREAAGRVLLAEPDVRRVENRLTFVRPDDVDGPGAKVPIAPLPGTVPAPSAQVPPTSAPGN